MIDAFLGAIVSIVVGAVNALLAAIGAILSVIVAALPDMPDLPELPAPFVTAESWVAWFFPVGTLLDILAFWLAMWLLWQITALVLRWAKALGED